MKTIDELIEELPQGSYESGWSQCAIYPIGHNSMPYVNGKQIMIKQSNWRTKEERSFMGINLLDAIQNFIAQYAKEDLNLAINYK